MILDGVFVLVFYGVYIVVVVSCVAQSKDGYSAKALKQQRINKQLYL